MLTSHLLEKRKHVNHQGCCGGISSRCPSEKNLGREHSPGAHTCWPCPSPRLPPTARTPTPTPIAFKAATQSGALKRRAVPPPGCSTSLTCLTSHSTRPVQAACSCDTPAFPASSLTSLVKQEAWGGAQESGLGSCSELSNRRQPQDFRVLVEMQIPPPGLKY